MVFTCLRPPSNAPILSLMSWSRRGWQTWNRICSPARQIFQRQSPIMVLGFLAVKKEDLAKSFGFSFFVSRSHLQFVYRSVLVRCKPAWCDSLNGQCLWSAPDASIFNVMLRHGRLSWIRCRRRNWRMTRCHSWDAIPMRLGYGFWRWWWGFATCVAGLEGLCLVGGLINFWRDWCVRLPGILDLATGLERAHCESVIAGLLAREKCDIARSFPVS